MRFADRTSWKAQSNAINAAHEALQRQGLEPVDLTESNPTKCGFKYPPQLLHGLTNPNSLTYEPTSLGLNTARNAVVDYYQRRGVVCDAAQILLTASTSEAYSFILRLLANPGDKVLIPRPSYPLFQFLLEINDVAFDFYPLVYGHDWQLDHEALANLIDDRTRAIILVNPNNPTGSYLNSADIDFLNKLASQHGLALISDEVFADYAYAKGDLCSLSGNQGALTFTLSGLSKVLALPQMKCGWALVSGPQEACHEALSRLEIITDTYLSVNTPVMQAMGQWLQYEEEIQGQIKQRVLANWQVLRERLDVHAQLLNAQGGWYASLKIPTVRSEEQWVLEFLLKDYVLVHPGYFFDFEREAYIVISLLPAVDVFTAAINKVMARIGAS